MEKNTNQDVNNELLGDELLGDELLDDGNWIESIQRLRKKKNHLTTTNKILIWVFSFLLILVLLLFNVNYFFTLTLKEWKLTEFEKNYMNVVKDNIINKFFVKSNTTDNIKTFDNNSKNLDARLKNMDAYISNVSVLFYEKKDQKKAFINKEKNVHTDLLTKIKNNQVLLVKYKFFPEELSSLVKDIRVLPILLTLNSIKIYMIDYVYIKTWKFKDIILSPVLDNSKIFNDFNITRKELRTSLEEDVQKIRELWVYLYLKNIKFNYMYNILNNSLANDYFINSFYTQFKEIIDYRVEKFKINRKNVKLFRWDYISLLAHIYNKTSNLIENKDVNQFPIDVNLLSYNPNNKILSFNVNIMLNDKDDAKTPVIWIATSLVSLLRESRLIIWKGIKMDNIKVQKVSKNIWGNKITYNKTALLFNTSVQSSVNVEVSDSEK